MKTIENIKKSIALFIKNDTLGKKDHERLEILANHIDENGRISRKEAIALTQAQSKNPIRGYENFISKVNKSIAEFKEELDDDYLLEVFKNFSLSTVQDDLIILAKVPLELHSTIKPNNTYAENKFINSVGESRREIKIFVSYASVDERDKNLFINYLKTELQERKIEIDLKLWEMKDIPIGISFDKVIREELEKCDYGFTLLSSAFTASDYILEVELALLLETEKLIPIGLVGDIPSLLENIQEIKGRKKKKQAQELKTKNIFTSRDNLFFDKCKTEQRQKEFVKDLIESLIHRKAYDEKQKKALNFIPCLIN